MKRLKLIIITGLSGSGKSSAIAAFEDAGFYCVDNMPVALLPKFLELPIQEDSRIAGLAFVMDLREKGFLSKYPAVLEELQRAGYDFEIIFLEADEKILVQRYSETRRHHPLAQGKSLLEGIRDEKIALQDLRGVADRIIDTSGYNIHAFKAVILEIAEANRTLTPLKITVLSFGYKYGIPPDADLMMDVRFLANPYFVPELKALDGNTPEVRQFVLSQRATRTFLKKFLGLLDYLLPLYKKEGKSYLTIAVGCTGGRHRSVTVASAIRDHILEAGLSADIIHRDIGQNEKGRQPR